MRDGGLALHPREVLAQHWQHLLGGAMFSLAQPAPHTRCHRDSRLIVQCFALLQAAHVLLSALQQDVTSADRARSMIARGSAVSRGGGSSVMDRL